MFLDYESEYETLLDRTELPTLELSRKRAILIDVYKNVMHQSPEVLWNSIPHSKTTRYITSGSEAVKSEANLGARHFEIERITAD